MSILNTWELLVNPCNYFNCHNLIRKVLFIKSKSPQLQKYTNYLTCTCTIVCSLNAFFKVLSLLSQPGQRHMTGTTKLHFKR